MAYVIVEFLIPGIRAKKKYGKRNLLFWGKYKLESGLNLPEGITCYVYCLKRFIVIESAAQEFKLPINRVVTATVMTKSQIQHQYVSSIGGTIAGAMSFGTIGAAIGGMARKKTIKNNTKYLVIAYQTQEDICYMIFDVTNKVSSAKKFQQRFKNNSNSENIVHEL
jgi:hypothetical protein